MGISARFDRNNKISPSNEAPSSAVSPPINSPASRIELNEKDLRKELDEKDLKEVFDRFDRDGKMSASELNYALSNVGNSVTTEVLNKMFSIVDSDEDMLISFEEFLHCYKYLEDLKDTFSSFDVNKDGSITADEFQKLFKTQGDKYSIELCRKQIAIFDSDGDGKVSFQEFRAKMVNSTFRASKP